MRHCKTNVCNLFDSDKKIKFVSTPQSNITRVNATIRNVRYVDTADMFSQHAYLNPEIEEKTCV